MTFLKVYPTQHVLNFSDTVKVGYQPNVGQFRIRKYVGEAAAIGQRTYRVIRRVGVDVRRSRLDGMNPPPIETCKHGFELGVGQYHQSILDTEAR
ncbi:hypothetical protein X743_28525 [Mesorhizobium sp. LNHC252B00]|nr:hypothetical protein X743_28525 [Mesorhizobium sp. LNHC252B00]